VSSFLEGTHENHLYNLKVEIAFPDMTGFLKNSGNVHGREDRMKADFLRAHSDMDHENASQNEIPVKNVACEVGFYIFSEL